MKYFRQLVSDWLPPIAMRAAARLRGRANLFHGDYPSWEDATSKCTGYSSPDIMAKVLDSTLKVKRGEAAFERDSVTFETIEYAWPVLSGLMWAAANNNGVLNVLDFGGALGSSYFQNKLFLNQLNTVRWNIVEQGHFVAAGKEYFETEELRFFSSIDSCLLSNKPNVILLSGVLQYLPAPYDLLEKLAVYTEACVIIDRTSFSTSAKDTLVIQKVPPSIYSADYPMWIFGKHDFFRFLETKWKTLASTPCPEGYLKTSNGLHFQFEGLLLCSIK